MFLEFKKYGIRFINDEIVLVDLRDSNNIIPSSSIGWIFNYGPPHDHNYNFMEIYLEEFRSSFLGSMLSEGTNMVRVCVESDCVIHKGSYCPCNYVRVPLLHEGKVIVDIYGLATSKSVNTVLLY